MIVCTCPIFIMLQIQFVDVYEFAILIRPLRLYSWLYMTLQLIFFHCRSLSEQSIPSLGLIANISQT